MSSERDPLDRSDIQIVDDFAQAKGLPRPGRLSGGGARIYHRLPERVKVIEGRNLAHPDVGRVALMSETSQSLPLPEPEL